MQRVWDRVRKSTIYKGKVLCCGLELSRIWRGIPAEGWSFSRSHSKQLLPTMTWNPQVRVFSEEGPQATEFGFPPASWGWWIGKMQDFLSDMVEIARVQDPADLFSSMVSPEPGFWSRSIISFRVGPRAELLTLSSQCLYCGKVPRLVEIQIYTAPYKPDSFTGLHPGTAQLWQGSTDDHRVLAVLVSWSTKMSYQGSSLHPGHGSSVPILQWSLFSTTALFDLP